LDSPEWVVAVVTTSSNPVWAARRVNLMAFSEEAAPRTIKNLPVNPRVALTVLWLLVSGAFAGDGGAGGTSPATNDELGARMGMTPLEVLQAVRHLAAVGLVSECGSRLVKRGEVPAMTVALDASYLGEAPPVDESTDVTPPRWAMAFHPDLSSVHVGGLSR